MTCRFFGSSAHLAIKKENNGASRLTSGQIELIRLVFMVLINNKRIKVVRGQNNVQVVHSLSVKAKVDKRVSNLLPVHLET